MIKEDIHVSGFKYPLTENYKNPIYITIDNLIEFVYEMERNQLAIRHIDNLKPWNFTEIPISNNDVNFLNVLLKNINILENVTDEEYKDYVIEFNCEPIIIFKSSSYNPRIVFEDLIDDVNWCMIITCQTKDEILEIAKGLRLLYDTIKDEFTEVNKEYNKKLETEKKDFEKVRDYGIKFNGSYISDNSKYIFKDQYRVGKRFIDEPLEVIDYTNLYRSDLKNSVLTVIKSEDYKNITFFYPKKFLPVSHKTDYGDPSKLYDDNGIMKTYADIILEKYNSSLLEYVFPLVVCKKCHVNKVFDIGCGTGIQSWLFNQNYITYTGIDKNQINVFPFRYNKTPVSFYNLKYPEVYKVKDNKLKSAYKNSMAILLHSHNILDGDDINSEELRLLMRYHQYVLISAESYDPNIVGKNEAVQKYCQKICSFGLTRHPIDNPTKELFINGYILFIRWGAKYDDID